MRTTRFALLAIAVALVGDVSSALGQDATLRYKWVKGDQVRYRTTQRSSTTMSGVPGLGELSEGGIGELAAPGRVRITAIQSVCGPSPGASLTCLLYCSVPVGLTESEFRAPKLLLISCPFGR